MFGAIWDLDGTLVDTEMNHFSAWRALVKERGRDLSYEEFLPTFGLRNDDVLVHRLGFDVGSTELAALAERKEMLFRASLQQDGIKTLPGALELVAHFRTLGVGQAIASSAPPANIDLMIQLLGLQTSFDAIVSGEDVKRGKPAPDIVLRAAERLEIPARRTVVLEDAVAGVEAGKAAGARVIAIASAPRAHALSAADLIVQSFHEVLWPIAVWERFVGE